MSADISANSYLTFTMKEVVEDLFEPFKANVDVWQLFVKNLTFALFSMHPVFEGDAERALLNQLRAAVTSLKFSCSVKLDGAVKSNGAAYNDSSGQHVRTSANNTGTCCDCYSKLTALKAIDDEINMLVASKDSIYSGSATNPSNDIFDSSILAEASRIEQESISCDLKVKKMKMECISLPPLKNGDSVDKMDGSHDEFLSSFFYPGSERVSCLACSESKLITGCYDGSVFLNLDVSNLNSNVALPKHNDAISSIKISSNFAVTGSLDGCLKLVNLETFECLKSINLEEQITALTELQGILYTGCSNGSLFKINIRTLNFIKNQLSVPEGFIAMEATQFDGKDVLVFLYPNALSIRQCNNGSLLVSTPLSSGGLCMEVNTNDMCYYLGLENSIYIYHPNQKMSGEVQSRHGAKKIKFFYGNLFIVSPKNKFFIYSTDLKKLFSYPKNFFCGNIIDFVFVDQKVLIITDANYYYIIDIPGIMMKLTSN